MDSQSLARIVVLISGNGSNLQAIIDAVQQRLLPAQLSAVISNRPDAYGLQRARRAAVPTQIVNHKDYADRLSFDRALIATIDEYQPDLVVLAGFMRILSDEFVTHYRGRLLNIHPSLLPKFRGLDTHRRAIESQEKEHGATVHFVTQELDGGPAIIQARLPVSPNETPKELAARVLEKEHIIYPRAIQWFAQGRLHLEDSKVMLDGKPLEQPVQAD
jgi:phosphoribosylglycinamide formyltransferase-1